MDWHNGSLADPRCEWSFSNDWGWSHWHKKAALRFWFVVCYREIHGVGAVPGAGCLPAPQISHNPQNRTRWLLFYMGALESDHWFQMGVRPRARRALLRRPHRCVAWQIFQGESAELHDGHRRHQVRDLPPVWPGDRRQLPDTLHLQKVMGQRTWPVVRDSWRCRISSNSLK